MEAIRQNGEALWCALVNFGCLSFEEGSGERVRHLLLPAALDSEMFFVQLASEGPRRGKRTRDDESAQKLPRRISIMAIEIPQFHSGLISCTRGEILDAKGVPLKLLLEAPLYGGISVLIGCIVTA